MLVSTLQRWFRTSGGIKSPLRFHQNKHIRAVVNDKWTSGCTGCFEPSSIQTRGAKTVSRRKLKDLEQGSIAAAPLSVAEPDDRPQYPPLLRGVQNHMLKFDRCVLLTKVGNFYELYFHHADEYGPLLGLKVSTRKTALGPISMAGFPIFQLERYLKILVEDLNRYVAISTEIELAASEQGKSGGLQFDRKVTRVITPGTLIDEKFLNQSQNNFLLSICEAAASRRISQAGESSSGDIGLAWLDLSTGDFFTQTATRALLPSVLVRIGAREIVLSESINHGFQREIELMLGHDHGLVTLHRPMSEFSSMTEWNSMLESPLSAGSNSNFTPAEQLAGHLILDYVRNRLQGSECQLRHPQRRHILDAVSIDRSSLRGLEILETSRDGFGKGSLLHAVRRTVTNSGARLLRERLIYPSTSLPEINMRLDLVTHFRNEEVLREAVINHLRRTHDVKRLVQKFSLNKGDADDLLALAKAIDETAQVHELLSSKIVANRLSTSPEPVEQCRSSPIKDLLSQIYLEAPMSLARHILNAIDEEGLVLKHQIEDDEASEVAVMVQEVVKDAAPEELSNLPKDVRTKTRSEGRNFIDDLEEPWIMRRNASEVLTRLHEELDDFHLNKGELQLQLRSELSAPSLTLRWTPGLGHICHIKSANGFDRAKLDEMHARMVSSSKSTRSFYLTKWSKLGARMDQVRKSIRAEELRIFRELRHHVLQNLVYLRRNATIMDELDVSTAFAVLATEQNWTRPILNQGVEHKVIGGRHPTVKLGLEEKGRSFVSNDLFVGESERVWIITGPNMAGKSTFLRQNALITILAQTGSYVPAEYAEIGIVDQIFSRIGAADDLFRDQSTFMVEMLETAAILKHATSRSFVIMDEVGRGTTPEDGTAVAFASLHHLYHHNRCRTLFATHFHALQEMTRDWDHIGRYCTDITEDEAGSFSFLHKLKPGVNKQSHALKIAKMAGLPDSAIEVAQHVLQRTKVME